VGCNNHAKKNQKAITKKIQEKVVVDKILNYPASGIKYDDLTFSFNFYFDDKTGYILNKIEVCSKDKIYQTIKTSDTLFIGDKKINFRDWNFDGYKDISIINNIGSGGISYSIWNYNPKVKKFIYNKELEAIGLEMDSISKCIIFHYRGGWQEEFWDTLKYKKDKLVFVKGMWQNQWNDEKGNQWRKRTYNRIINNRNVRKVDSCIIKE
jgi:hypothetical protein